MARSNLAELTRLTHREETVLNRGSVCKKNHPTSFSCQKLLQSSLSVNHKSRFVSISWLVKGNGVHFRDSIVPSFLRLFVFLHRALKVMDSLLTSEPEDNFLSCVSCWRKNT